MSLDDFRGEERIDSRELIEARPRLLRTRVTFDEQSTHVRVGQRWRQADGYLCDVVGFAGNGWPWVRHVNAKSGGHMVNPAWFDHWEMVHDA